MSYQSKKWIDKDFTLREEQSIQTLSKYNSKVRKKKTYFNKIYDTYIAYRDHAYAVIPHSASLYLLPNKNTNNIFVFLKIPV
jgi:hypothetical protein